MPAKKKTGGSATKKPRSSLGAQARAAAFKRMTEMYPEVWGDTLGEERAKLGLPADGGRQTRLQKFVAKMRAAGVEQEDIDAALVEAGFVKGDKKAAPAKTTSEE